MVTPQEHYDSCGICGEGVLCDVGKLLVQDARWLELWRSVTGPHAELTGPLIRFASKVQEEATGWQAGDATPLAKFLAEFVTWMRTDEYVHGSGPSEGYRSRREQAEQARELGLKLLTRLDLLETTVTQLAAQLRELA